MCMQELHSETFLNTAYYYTYSFQCSSQRQLQIKSSAFSEIKTLLHVCQLQCIIITEERAGQYLVLLYRSELH